MQSGSGENLKPSCGGTPNGNKIQYRRKLSATQFNAMLQWCMRWRREHSHLLSHKLTLFCSHRQVVPVSIVFVPGQSLEPKKRLLQNFLSILKQIVIFRDTHILFVAGNGRITGGWSQKRKVHVSRMSTFDKLQSQNATLHIYMLQCPQTSASSKPARARPYLDRSITV